MAKERETEGYTKQPLEQGTETSDRMNNKLVSHDREVEKNVVIDSIDTDLDQTSNEVDNHSDNPKLVQSSERKKATPDAIWYAISTKSRRESSAAEWLDRRLKQAGEVGLSEVQIPCTYQEVIENGLPVTKTRHLSLLYVKSDSPELGSILASLDPSDRRERNNYGIVKACEVREPSVRRSMQYSGINICEYKIGDNVVEISTGIPHKVIDVNVESDGTTKITISMTIFNKEFTKTATLQEIAYKV